MKITKCLIACDLNQVYLDFYPLVRKYWKDIVGIPTILILISDTIPDCLETYKDEVILFKPIDNIHTAFQAQCIRILYPCLLNEEDNIIISDMDLIPLNQTYYVNNVKNIDDDNFVIYRNVISEYNQYPICFCLANTCVWKDIFSIDNEYSIRQRLKTWYKLYNDTYQISSAFSQLWACDQLQLFNYVNTWENNNSGKVFKFTDEETNFRRLDRSDMSNIMLNINQYKMLIKNNFFSDFHLPRPLQLYEKILDKIL